MRLPASMRWVALALLGILVAAAVSIAASRLASQQIGLASQPVSAGDALAPGAAKQPAHRQRVHHRRKSRRAPATPPAEPPAPSESPPSSGPPTYVPPSPPPSEPSQPGGEDGEHGGGGEAGADD